jgi:hypothetical protein
MGSGEKGEEITGRQMKNGEMANYYKIKSLEYSKRILMFRAYPLFSRGDVQRTEGYKK